MRSIGMLNLRAEYQLMRERIRSAVDEVLESHRFIGGPFVERLEEALKSRLAVADAIAVSSGTDALLGALMALDIAAGDEVIVPTFTFFATAGAVARVGALPVFVDIDADTFNLDPKKIEAAITPRTRAIIVVHLFGQCADMEAIDRVAQRHGLQVIEDAAQAIGANYQGRPAGSLGRIACFSFYPTKNLGGFGEGGLVTTNDSQLGAILRQVRNHGESRRYYHERVGGNFRLDSLKAAILLVKLDFLDEFTRKRRANAAMYDRLLADAGVQTPRMADGRHHVYHQYSILHELRDDLASFLKDHGIETGVYYPAPLHRQPCFSNTGGGETDLPVAQRICKQILSLPCHPMLTADDVGYVAECIHQFCEKREGHNSCAPRRALKAASISQATGVTRSR